MMGRGNGGRGRPQSVYSPRFEERERRSGWGVAPPSRHLWVGNLSSHITEGVLSEYFLRFGDVEEIAYIPGRNFAFVNYQRVEDAVIALRGLQGVNIGGMPLRIEFAKGDRASMLPQDADLRDNDARLTMERGDSLSRRDVRPQHSSPEKSYEKSKGNKNADPSEILWIGFPKSMNVDELVLRRAFSPFGEIDKISTFPGRTYAFVQYKSVVAACRAKEALQGKLFNNPRVSICFARSDSSEQGRGPASGVYPPHIMPVFHSGLTEQGDGETFHRERSFDSPIGGEFLVASPRFLLNVDRMAADPNIGGFGRGSSFQTSAIPGSNVGGVSEHARVQELGSERWVVEDPYDRHRESPADDRPAPWLDFSFGKAKRTPPFEEPWGSENDSLPLAKKLKMESFPDNELPEYPFSDLEHEKRAPSHPKLFPGLPDHLAYKSMNSAPYSRNRGPDPSRAIARPYMESAGSRGTFDGPTAAPGSSLQRFSAEPHQPQLKKEWKWEGTIAKGGNAICRARCFPVGKVLDFMLPDVLNCTARTGLDMLAKHYYQAASTWVVFFVPETDADISFYNEFMHYLGEKQRAAVSKLGEKVSLFLVPPSDFSEQVLKVPGKVSISGVILKFQQPSSSASSFNNQLETMGSKTPYPMTQPKDEASFHGDVPSPKPRSPDFRPFAHDQSYVGSSSGRPVPVLPSVAPPNKPGISRPLRETAPDFCNESRPDHFQSHNPPPTSNWSNNTLLPSSSFGVFPPAPTAASRSFENSKTEEHPPVNSRAAQGMTSSIYTPEPAVNVSLPVTKFPQQQQEIKPQVTSSVQLPLQPEQLAHLAVLLGQQKQSGNPSSRSGENRCSDVQNANLQTQVPVPHSQVPLPYSQAPLPYSQAPHVPQAFGLQVSQALQLQQASQVQQLQLQASSASTVQQPMGNPLQQNSQQASNNNREEAEADPQKRLQATLQLAAQLLQQIQQQAKT